MADDLIKWNVGQDYEPIGAGKAGVALVNEHLYRGIRVAISDAQPDPGHLVFHSLKGRTGTSHYDIPSGYVLYIRANSDEGKANGHARVFDV